MADSVLIVRLGAMGDIIHALPAVAALRRLQPDALIGWAVEERWSELLAARGAAAMARGQHKPLVDRVHLVNTRAWRRALGSDETWNEIVLAIRGLRTPQYDTALDLQGAIKSAVVARISRASRIAGFRSPRERLAAMVYTETVATQKRHIIEQNLALIEHAFGPLPEAVGDRRSLLPHDPAAEAWCERQTAKHGDFAILTPGAGWGAKQWPASRYAEVARALRERGLVSLVNHTATEQQLANEVVAASAGAAIPVSCSVGELIALSRRARLFVGGDTGPMHLAALLGVPVVALFGPTDPARNGPYGTESIVLRSEKSRTSYSHIARRDRGLLSITAADVIGGAATLLERARG